MTGLPGRIRSRSAATWIGRSGWAGAGDRVQRKAFLALAVLLALRHRPGGRPAQSRIGLRAIGVAVRDTRHLHLRRPERLLEGRPRGARHLDRHLPVRAARLYGEFRGRPEFAPRADARVHRPDRADGLQRHRAKRQPLRDLRRRPAGAIGGRPPEPVYRYVAGKKDRWPNHMEDFLQCVRTGARPRCNEDEAFIDTVTFLMSVESFRRKRQVRWDRKLEEIV